MVTNRQAILKHDISTEAYQEKLQTRLATYLDSPIGVVTSTPKKTGVPIAAIAAGRSQSWPSDIETGQKQIGFSSSVNPSLRLTQHF
jgi:hypothetical protein